MSNKELFGIPYTHSPECREMPYGYDYHKPPATPPLMDYNDTKTWEQMQVAFEEYKKQYRAYGDCLNLYDRNDGYTGDQCWLVPDGYMATRQLPFEFVRKWMAKYGERLLVQFFAEYVAITNISYFHDHGSDKDFRCEIG